MYLLAENINIHHQEFEKLLSSYNAPEQYIPLVIDATYPHLEKALGYVKFCTLRADFKSSRIQAILSKALQIIYRSYYNRINLEDLYLALTTISPSFYSFSFSFERKKLFDIINEADTTPKKIFTQNYFDLLRYSAQNITLSREEFHAWRQCFGTSGLLTLMKVLRNSTATQTPNHESLFDYVALSLNQMDKNDMNFLLTQCIFDPSGYLWPVITSFLEEKTVALCSQDIELCILMAENHSIALTRLKDPTIFKFISSILATYPLNNLLVRTILPIATLMYVQKRGEPEHWLNILAQVYSRCSFPEWETLYEQWYQSHENSLRFQTYQQTRIDGYVHILDQYFQDKSYKNKQAMSVMTQEKLLELTKTPNHTPNHMMAQNSQDFFEYFSLRLANTLDSAVIQLNIALQSPLIFYPWVNQWLDNIVLNEELGGSDTWIELLASLLDTLLNDQELSNDHYYELAKIYVTLCFCTQKYFKNPNESSYEEFLYQCQKIIDEMRIEFLQSNVCQGMIQIIPGLYPQAAPMTPLLENEHFERPKNNDNDEILMLPQQSNLKSWFERARTYGSFCYKVAPLNLKAIMGMIIIGSEVCVDFKNHLHHQWELRKREIQLSDRIHAWMDACEMPIQATELVVEHSSPKNALATDTMDQSSQDQLQRVASSMTFSSHSPGATLSENSFFTPIFTKTDYSEEEFSLCNEYAASRR